MSKSQVLLIYLLISLLLLSVALFRQTFFHQSSWGPFAFVSCVVAAFLIVAYVVSQWTRRRFRWIVLGWLLAEGVVWLTVYYTCREQIYHPFTYALAGKLYRGGGSGVMHNNAIQADPNLAVYDKGLIYRLKSGVGQFSNLEFSTTYRVNSMGLRDDERSLQHPEVILLGDSYTMGWGVEQEQTFAQQLEQRIKVPVLNAGISSFGTARELMLLRRLNRRDCKAVYLQYCENDLGENRQYVTNDSLFYTQQQYENTVRANTINRWFFPFKLSFIVVQGALRRALAARAQASESGQTAVQAATTPVVTSATGAEIDQRSVHTQHFVDILSKIQQVFDGPIVVFELSPHGYFSDLTQQLPTQVAARALQNVRFIRTDTLLRADHYLMLDAHLNPSGHAIVADLLAKDYERLREVNTMASIKR
ncbi:hypothetical protein DYU11_16525 [Fibrisoma montanum]|uniref:SGNH hydrolase-type esterase domain-containing protein n=1 Tax=Fibrisoma montanum TaxID=2305895 RepID=A0A418M959_9BACT|nr:GDSL-type esterase/lipase family protein [Fibrisoma montanum]RIV22613.1 hypothetical protein DYU11_16525 [Fibrisoma montanum]